ncbi:ESX secretion-associated protein EspG [Nocardia australiensis]|uniref:ESX secretion-associated protein EspG n=1 Tax=Nocardia australiensis TaxID=2887191 RepID=UPI001D155226|nr:ESX secretion-associated protein EspG [Nocardia australiensis]
MAEWNWEPDDFAALWFSPANDRFPNPLRFTSRFAYRDDFELHRVTMRERYSHDELEEIQLALNTLSESTMRIEIFGGTTQHKNSNGGTRSYRIVGARTDYHAVSLAQATFADTNGPIRCRLFPVAHLPSELVNSLPRCKPGNQPSSTFHPEDVYGNRNGHMESVTHNSPRERYQRLLHRPADGGGSALLYTGGVNTLADPLTTVQWHDITNDGRYTELRGQHITVRPTAPTDLTTQFTTWIDRVTQRLREAEEDSW